MRRKLTVRGPRGEMMARCHHVASQPEPFQYTYGKIGVVEFPPAKAVTRGTRIGVMVVVPAFAVGDEPYELRMSSSVS